MEDKTLIKKRIDWFCKNKINAFSPTISPAPKSVERNEIESLYEGILWFVLNGVKEIVIEKKYMGSIVIFICISDWEIRIWLVGTDTKSIT
mgnify:CR=1 FL=1